MPRKEHIAIAIPSLTGHVPLALADWVARMTANNYDDDCPYGFSFLPVQNKQPFEYARNVAVREFLKTDADRLWFVDDDMIPYPRTLGLLTAEADIAVGAYIRAGAKPDGTISLDVLLFQDAVNDDGDETFRSVKFEPREDFFAIKSGGTGCMLIRRRVLEDPRMMYPTTYTDWRGKARDLFDTPGELGVVPPIFRTHRKPNGNTDLGEDHDFCLRAGKLGYTIEGHMLFGMDHQKTTTAEMILRTIAREKVITRQAVEETCR